MEALKAERDAIEAELKDATVDLRSQFLAALAADGAVDEPALSAGALGAALAPLQRRVRESLARQEALAERVRQAHEAFVAARGGASGRDEALGRLCAAYDAFRDLTGNLNEGVKFYNDLTQVSDAFGPRPLSMLKNEEAHRRTDNPLASVSLPKSLINMIHFEHFYTYFFFCSC